MDPLTKSEREKAILEARRLYPEMSPVLAGWVFDFVNEMGEEECLRRIKEGFYETKQEKSIKE
jgi:hypothetical protein